MRQGRRSGVKLFRIIILLLLVGAGVLGWRLITEASFFKVSKVSVTGDRGNLLTESLTKDILGQNIIFLPEEKIEEVALQNLLLEKVSFKRIFPGEVVAELSWREPILVWQSSSGRFLLDKVGVAYATASAEPLPQVSEPNSNFSLGQKVAEDKLSLVEDVLRAVEGKFTVLTVAISGRDATIQLSGNIQVILNTEANLNQAISALQLITTQAKIEGRLPRVVDLRFPKPVVTY